MKLGDLILQLIQETVAVELDRRGVVKLSPHERDRIDMEVSRDANMLNGMLDSSTKKVK